MLQFLLILVLKLGCNHGIATGITIWNVETYINDVEAKTCKTLFVSYDLQGFDLPTTIAKFPTYTETEYLTKNFLQHHLQFACLPAISVNSLTKSCSIHLVYKKSDQHKLLSYYNWWLTWHHTTSIFKAHSEQDKQ